MSEIDKEENIENYIRVDGTSNMYSTKGTKEKNY